MEIYRDASLYIYILALSQAIHIVPRRNIDDVLQVVLSLVAHARQQIFTRGLPLLVPA